VDDLFQQTWLKAIRQLAGYRNRDRFLSWLLRIAHNLAIDLFRTEKRSREIDSPLDTGRFRAFPAESGNVPFAKLDRKELADAIAKGIAALPAEQREVFVLRQEEITFREIAEIQKVSINTALGRMQYALRNLRQELSIWMHATRKQDGNNQRPAATTAVIPAKGEMQ
jgi:RNA polymerase sigma-70 factor (ECF subfamily)